jgi:L-asparagine transporter-like permease
MKKKDCINEIEDSSNKDLNAYSLAGIGIGGIIGAGFFLGSSMAINQAGPSVILAFLFGGLIMSQVLGSMTSISINRPVQGSFRVHTEEFLGKYMGFMLGWVILISGVLTLASEAIATGIFVKYWIPKLPSAVIAMVAIIIAIVINGLGTKYFGLIETIMAFIKMAVLIIIIVLGSLFLFQNGMIVKPNPFGSFHSFFPNQVVGFLKSMLIVIFTYNGFNTVDMVTSEVRKPCYEVPKATVILTIGITFLYVTAMAVIISSVDWNQINTTVSPFVQSFNRMGFGWASALINGVILVATLSVMIGSLYGCVQMLVSLAGAKEAPAFLRKRTAGGMYPNSMAAVGSVTILVVLLGFLLGTKLFNYLISSSAYFSFFNWTISLITYIKWLKHRREKEIYNSPLIKGRWSAYASIFVIIALLIISLGVRDFRIGFYVALSITVLASVFYKAFKLKA